ncbi:hypothetical protein CL614_00145 [archaeon]|nr:hypothetical protein [archaeon]
MKETTAQLKIIELIYLFECAFTYYKNRENIEQYVYNDSVRGKCHRLVFKVNDNNKMYKDDLIFLYYGENFKS